MDMAALATASPAPGPLLATAMVAGELAAMDATSLRPLVRWSDTLGLHTAPARSLVALATAHVGAPLALMFLCGDPAQPVIVGLLDAATAGARRAMSVDADGHQLVLHARQCLQLRCGAASITLHADGTVIVQGTEVVSRAEGLNRILGGSIHLN
ncbi:hypothetical protein ASF43_00385 [Pseudorhodoferax sp. Leaf267]|nr:hypothetical protein ASF43_00385 [Pseudorhodoferax sp. Leaf267]